MPYSKVRNVSGLRLSSPGVVPQRDQRPRWIVDYSWWNVNQETLPLAPKEAIQFRHALNRLLQEILLADPKHGPPEMMKVDIAGGFYRIQLNLDDTPKLGVVFPTKESKEPLVTFPLVLPVGWVNLPPAFCAATETSTDLANARIRSKDEPSPHVFDSLASKLDNKFPSKRQQSSDIPDVECGPCLPNAGKQRPLQYINVFMDNLLASAQGKWGQHQVRRILMKAIDDVFCPLDFYDKLYCRDPVSIKKLKKEIALGAP